MEVTSTQSTATTSATSTSAQSSSVLTTDFEVFLQMLTAQARYQDPLDPLESSEYSAQLAQFSMVEQQVATNSLMEQLLAALTTTETGNMAQWIGMDALTTESVAFSGTPISIAPDPEFGADEMYLVVKDSSGNTVDTRQLPVSNEVVEWSGVALDGSTFPNGTYSFEIETRTAGSVVDTQPARTYARVTEARFEDGAMQIILDGGVSVASDSVLGLRAPT